MAPLGAAGRGLVPRDDEETPHPHLFAPGRLGPMQVRNRVVLTPHGHLVSSLWGNEKDAERHIASWRARAEAGWVDGVSAHVRNPLPPGFEPTGAGAQIHGHFRQPYFVDRVERLADVLHEQDTRLSVQMILQGGTPHAASSVLSGPVINLVPHALTAAEIDWFVEEYRHGAEQVRAAGADGVELHLNHDDLLEWFGSPLTNRRDDEYGGSLENRLRFPVRILRAAHEAVGPSLAIGVRLNVREEEPGGYDIGGAVEIARSLEAAGLVDWLSMAAGSPWGSPSYIQSHHHEPAAWAALAGEVRAAVSVPVVYTGRVTSPAVAEEVLAAGHADLVGMARAVIADGDLLTKARTGRTERSGPASAATTASAGAWWRTSVSPARSTPRPDARWTGRSRPPPPRAGSWSSVPVRRAWRWPGSPPNGATTSRSGRRRTGWAGSWPWRRTLPASTTTAPT